MATMVLTVVGTALGGPVGGAIGATLGQVIDSQILFAPKGRQRARLSDLRLQTSRYGDQVPRLYGVIRVAGSVIWATDLVEHRKKQSAGKGQPKITTYSYSASFAVAISCRPILAVRRIWADGNLLRGTAGDFKSAIGAFRLHGGGEDQGLDPLIAAHKGAAATPAHRGIAYAVFEDLQLADFGNRIPSLTFEVVADDGAVHLSTIAHDLSGGAISARQDEAMPMLHGYAASGGSVADALDPLVSGLDAALCIEPEGLALALGREEEGEVSHDLIGAAFNGDEERGLRHSRGRVEDVPVRLVVQHYDPARDYQAGAQTAERPGPGRLETSLDLPAALDADIARALAASQLQRRWTGRSVLELRCDWRALAIDPGAVVSIEGEAGRWRLEKSEWEAMGVRLRLKRVAATGPVSIAASSGSPVAQLDALHGPTRLVLAELPPAGDAVPTTPLVVVAASGSEQGWRMAELFVEDGGSGALTSIGGTAPAATMGEVLEPPESGVNSCLVDTLSRIEVELLRGDMALETVDDAVLLGGANCALIGPEVIQFRRAEQIGAARWRLGGLLRGRQGTEWAMALHEAGEAFLLLDQECLLDVPSEHLHMGSALLVDAIGIGDTAPVRASVQVTGQALLPLAPVHVRADRESGEWQLRWIRRSRSGWRWNDAVDAPLAEEREVYQIRMLHAGALVRSAEVSAERWTYDAAMIAADRARGFSGAMVAEIRQVGTYGAGRAGQATLFI